MIKRWLVLAVVLFPSGVPAQTVQTFEELPSILKVDQETTLIVTDTRGRTVKGKLSALSETSLTLVTGGNIGARRFVRPDIVEVQKQIPDSILNGGLIGLMVGFGLPALICVSRSDGSETVPCMAGSLVLGGLPGLGIGLGIDARRTRKMTLFHR